MIREVTRNGNVAEMQGMQGTRAEGGEECNKQTGERGRDIRALTDSHEELGVRGSGAHTPSLQQRHQRSVLFGSVLTPQSGAAASRVHAARLALTQRTRQTAAAARLAHPLGAVTWQRLALAERTGITRLTAHHRPRRMHRAGKRRKQRREPERARSRHGAEPDTPE